MEFRLERFVTECLYQGTLCPLPIAALLVHLMSTKRDHHCTHEDTGMDCHEGTMNEGIYGISLPHIQKGDTLCTKRAIYPDISL